MSVPHHALMANGTARALSGKASYIQCEGAFEIGVIHSNATLASPFAGVSVYSCGAGLPTVVTSRGAFTDRPSAAD